jgi:hypothetical protein
MELTSFFRFSVTSHEGTAWGSRLAEQVIAVGQD